MSTHLEKAVAFLNANFSPWTFSGDEPVTLALEALLRESAKAALNEHVCPDCPDCTTTIGQEEFR